MFVARFRSVAWLLLALFGGPLAAQTTILTWSENPVSTSFTLTSSWVANVSPVPAPSLSTLAQFNQSGAVQPVFTTSASVLGLVFQQTAGSYFIPSQTSTIPTGVTLSIGSSGIVSNSPAAQTIGVPLNFVSTTATPITANATGQIRLTGPVTLGSGGVIFGGNGGGGIISGNIASSSNTAGKLSVGGGSWTFSGVNTFAGPVEITGGTMVLGSSGALPSGKALTFNPASASSAYLDVGSQNTSLGQITFRGAGSAVSTISLGNQGVLNLLGDVLYDAASRPGTASISGGTLALGSSSRTFKVGNSPDAYFDLSIGAKVSGTGGIIKQGAGLLELSNSLNLFSGPITINEGVLAVTATGAIPAGNAVVVDGFYGTTTLLLSGTSQSLSSLTLGGTTRPSGPVNVVELGYGGMLSLGSSSGGQLTVYGNGTNYAARIGSEYYTGVGQLSFNSGGTGTINVTRNNTFAVSVIDLWVTSDLAGSLAVQKTGVGSVLLEGSGALLTGSLNVNQGTVVFGSAFAPGDQGSSGGTNSLGGGVSVTAGGVITAGVHKSLYSTGSSVPSEIIMAKPVSISSGAQLGSWDIDQGIRLNLAGLVTLQPSTSAISVSLGGYEGTVISGPLDSASPGTALTLVNASQGRRGLLALTGAVGAGVNSINVNGAGLILSTVPTTATLGVTSGGYLGVAPGAAGAAAPSPQAVVDLVSSKQSFAGTFGFDSYRDAITSQVFADNVSFVGFGSGLTLGSMTSAILTGTLTPASSAYTFGNGGGALILRGSAALTNDGANPRSVSVLSATGVQDNALALILQTANSFTGGLTVSNSLVVFDAAGALPAAKTSMVVGTDAYLGFTEKAGVSGPGGFRTLLNPANFTTLTISSNATLGLDSSQYIADKIAVTDSASSSIRYLADRLDLSLLGPIGLGTATRATLLGTLMGQMFQGSRSLRLAGVDEGVLEVRSRLTDANVGALTVGGLSALPNDGTVILSAQNTYSGGTTLLSGTLVAASSQRMSAGTVISGPLGLGALTVPANAQWPSLVAGNSMGTTLGNNVLLGSRLALGATPSSGEYRPQLTLSGTISDSGGTGGLDIYSTTTLKGTNTFSGGVNLYGGYIFLGSSSTQSGGPLGTGTLSILSGDGSSYRGLATMGPQIISNPVVFNVGSQPTVFRFGSGALTLSGSVTLYSPVNFSMNSEPLYLTGVVSGPGSLGASGSGPVVLSPASGANTYTGGTSIYSGRVIFGSAQAIPAASLLASGAAGYIGFASNAGTFQSDFLARFDLSATTGTIGLDSLVTGQLNRNPAAGATLFTQAIDLTGFSSSVRLGSASTAIISGDIKPAGNVYNFGGGGGWLEIDSGLKETSQGGTTLSLSSPSSTFENYPLTLRLYSSVNTFTGGANVSGSALVFGPGSMPTSGLFTVGAGGYVGSEEAVYSQTATDAFLGRITVGSTSAALGFDVAPGGTGFPVSAAIDLTKLKLGSNVSNPEIFLGTTTQATLTGQINLLSGQTTYRFAGYKGGQLTVGTTLSSGAVQIGDSSTVAFHGNPANSTAISTVTLTGNNTYTGGTTLASGQLLVGNASALGYGVLTVTSPSSAYGSGLPYNPMLGSAADGLVIPNQIVVSGGGLSLAGANSFTLSGVISGSGGLLKTGSGTVTLTGINSFSGGVSLDQGTLVFGSAGSVSSSHLYFVGGASPTARFLETSTIGGIYSDAPDARVEVAAGKTLTINPVSSPGESYSYPTYFGGSFAPVAAGNSFNLVFSGTVPAGSVASELRLTGESAYLGTTAVRSGGNLVAATSAAFGQSAVTIDGGRLALATGVNLTNPLTFSSGVLGGEGAVTTAASITVGASSRLEPGFELAGVLNFTAATGFSGQVLSLLGGGAYRWKIADATDTTGGWDRVNVTGSVSIAANAGSPFTVSMAPVGPLGLLTGVIASFDPAIAYAWPILSATSITGFTAGSFVVDASAFGNLAPDYKFSVDLVGSSLVLNYNPAAVPEPSTWVMLLSGAAAGAVWLRRRRRN